MAWFGGLCLGLCLYHSVHAAGLPDAAVQTNAVAAVAPSPAQPAAVSTVSLAMAMGLEAPPVTNASDTKTNLPQSAATNAAFVLDDKHKLAIGDRLSFRIQEDEEDPKPLFVTDSGDLEVPYIGRVPAEGKSCRQLAAEIKTALEKDYYYQATVMLAVDVMTKSHGRVYLVGALRMPGPVELPSDELFTLSKAILRSGGFTDYADRRHVNVTRKGDAGKDAPTNAPPVNTTTTNDGKETFIVDVGEIFDKGKIETDLTLESGDLIFVPDSRGRVYLTGAVRLPGPVEFPSDEVLTLSKAILRAGGFTDYADKRHVKVTRKGAAGKDPATRPATPPGASAKDDKETFTVDVGEILDKGKIETDLTLESGDMISVPERLIRF
jgi:protein involved in polysaccharide export with SLBB domain